MVRLVSKSYFMYFVYVLILFTLSRLWLRIHDLDRFILEIPLRSATISLNYYCKTILQSQCKASLNASCCAIILSERQGRLGNRMFMFASALGIALTYSCRLAVDERILDELRTI